MKTKTALYASLAFNVALLVLVAWPRPDHGIAFAQVAPGQALGNYVALSVRTGNNQDSLWLANRSTGQMFIYQYALSGADNPIQVVGERDMRADLEERQLGNLMLMGTLTSDDESVVFLIDTDSERMTAYRYNRSRRTADGIQKINLRDYFTPANAATPAPRGR